MNLTETPSGTEIQIDNFTFFFGNKNSSLNNLKNQFSYYRFSRIRQTHSDIILKSDPVFLNQDYSLLPEGDAHWTSEENLALCISTADCIPLLIADLDKKIVCAVHAGWKGIENRIIPKTAHQLMQQSVDLRSCLFLIGPHIQSSSFEVENNVANQILSSIGLAIESGQELISTSSNEGKVFLDLNAICKIQLQEFGIHSEQIYDLHIDTKTNFNFHSYRRDKADSGRQISFVLKN